MGGAVQANKVAPRLVFAAALAAAAVPGLWVLAPLALYLSVRHGGRAAKVLSWVACAELIAAAAVLAIKALS